MRMNMSTNKFSCDAVTPLPMFVCILSRLIKRIKTRLTASSNFVSNMMTLVGFVQ